MTTKEEVRQSINSRLKTAATRIEGGLTQDIIGSVSYELANIIDTKIDVILDNAFVSTADIEHLKIKGEELGLFQNEATSAIVVAKLQMQAQIQNCRIILWHKQQTELFLKILKKKQPMKAVFLKFRWNV